MTFFSILLALIFEQQRALRSQHLIAKLLRCHLAVVKLSDTNKTKRNIIAWLGIVLPWTLAVGLIYFALYQIHFVFAFLWNIVVVYFTLGFRQFSQYFTAIQRALNDRNVPLARHILREWINIDTAEMSVSEIVRHTLIHAVIASHRYVFGVFFWFLMPIGPAGSVLYRIAYDLTQIRIGLSFSKFANQAFFLIDWVPARLTAFSFGVVGNFEDAIYAWRNDARCWQSLQGRNESVLLAASSGALGVRLLDPPSEPSSIEVLSEADHVEAVRTNGDCTPHTLSIAAALVWRALILWMSLLLMVTVAVWFG